MGLIYVFLQIIPLKEEKKSDYMNTPENNPFTRLIETHSSLVTIARITSHHYIMAH